MTQRPSALEPPGPKGHLLLGNLPELRADPLGFLAAARLHGDVVRYRVMGVPATLVSRPDLIERVLSANVDDFRKGRVFQAVRPITGNGLLLSEGDEWRRQRRIAQPAFRPDRLRAYGEPMGAAAHRAVGAWRDGDTRDIHRDLQRLTLAIAARALFGVDIHSQADEIGDALEVFLERFSASARTGMLIPLRAPTPGNLRLRRAVRRLDVVVYRLIRERRERRERGGPRVEQADDLLDSLLAAHPGPGGSEGDRQVRDQVTTLLLAGHATTDVALTWSVFLLAHHPMARERVAAEANEIGADRPLGPHDLPRLRYAGQVFREALRLYPPVWGLPRVSLTTTALDGYRIPRGSSVVVSQWVTHRDRRYWDEPESFIPERWENEGPPAVPRYAYFPFGGGSRSCLGQAFALMEGTLLLSTIARRFSWTLAPGQTVVPWPTFTLQPRDGLQIVLRERPRAKGSSHADG